jgi:hypothetical protein
MREDYKGYILLTVHDTHGVVLVYDRRFPITYSVNGDDTAVYQATSPQRAKRWVDAYREGRAWATIEAWAHKKERGHFTKEAV